MLSVDEYEQLLELRRPVLHWNLFDRFVLNAMRQRDVPPSPRVYSRLVARLAARLAPEHKDEALNLFEQSLVDGVRLDRNALGSLVYQGIGKRASTRFVLCVFRSV